MDILRTLARLSSVLLGICLFAAAWSVSPDRFSESRLLNLALTGLLLTGTLLILPWRLLEPPQLRAALATLLAVSSGGIALAAWFPVYGAFFYGVIGHGVHPSAFLPVIVLTALCEAAFMALVVFTIWDGGGAFRARPQKSAGLT